MPVLRARGEERKMKDMNEPHRKSTMSRSASDIVINIVIRRTELFPKVEMQLAYCEDASG